jgi:hypothetical protein
VTATVAVRKRLLYCGAGLSALAEPAGAALGLVGVAPALHPGFLALAAGAMLFVAPVSKPFLSAAERLDRMDGRAPVPMAPMMANHQKQNMRDHLLAVQEIVVALASDDFAAVERAAARMGFSEEREQMCTHMGAAAPGFTEQALAFHHAADRIGIAARERDPERILGELGATLEACTSCHSTWRQQVVDEATWEGMTSTAPTTHGAPR